METSCERPTFIIKQYTHTPGNSRATHIVGAALQCFYLKPIRTRISHTRHKIQIHILTDLIDSTAVRSCFQQRKAMPLRWLKKTNKKIMTTKIPSENDKRHTENKKEAAGPVDRSVGRERSEKARDDHRPTPAHEKRRTKLQIVLAPSHYSIRATYFPGYMMWVRLLVVRQTAYARTHVQR